MRVTRRNVVEPVAILGSIGSDARLLWFESSIMGRGDPVRNVRDQVRGRIQNLDEEDS